MDPMTGSKLFSIQACNRTCPPEETGTAWFYSPPAGQPPPDTVALLPRSGDRTDWSTDDFHLLQALLTTAADQPESTVIVEILTIFGGNIAERWGPLESANRAVDRIMTYLVGALAYIGQPGFNS